MTAMEEKFIKSMGPSVFVIFKYVATYPFERDVDIIESLGISHKTVSSALKKMTDCGIIKRVKVNNVREIVVLDEKCWKL